MKKEQQYYLVALEKLKIANTVVNLAREELDMAEDLYSEAHSKIDVACRNIVEIQDHCREMLKEERDRR